MDPVELLHRYHAALNDVDLDRVESMFAENAEYLSPGIGAISSRTAIIAAMRSYFAEYPDQVSIDDRVEAVGTDRARSQWRLKATSKSTGEAYVRRGTETIRFTSEGLILRVEVEDGYVSRT